MSRNSFYYILTLGFLGLVFWITLDQGRMLESGREIQRAVVAQGQQIQEVQAQNTWDEFLKNFHHPLAILILQIISIMLTARVLGGLMSVIGQPTVIGEILAGIVLGPSILGFWFPGITHFLFPLDSLQNLQFLGQIGLILFMFIIGMELDLGVIRNKASVSMMIGYGSILIPFAFGVGLAYYMYSEFAPDNVAFLPFTLFMGISLSITAFPVLARIVQERGLTRTPIGTLVITSAAANDILAWCILAMVIAVVKAGSIAGAGFTLIFSVVYVLFMIFVVKPLLQRLTNRYFTHETISKPIVAIFFMLLMGSAYLTEVIGIHALFGAFMAGVIIPSNSQFRLVLARKIEDVSLVLLLPLFFVLTGLRTEIGVLNSAHQWEVFAMVIAVAVLGKFAGSAFTARFVGQSWKNSLMIGALMNTRGLMELIVLNIGYDLGILSTEVFSMLVLMALVTTIMTGPLLDLINFISRRKKSRLPQVPKAGFRILISFGAPVTGSRLLRLAGRMRDQRTGNPEITAIHLTPTSDITIEEARLFEQESFEPILATATDMELTIHTHYRASNQVNRDIIQFANKGNYNLMLVGSSRPLFSNEETGGKLKVLFEEVDCSIGVLIDKEFSHLRKILALITSSDDQYVAAYGEAFLADDFSMLTIATFEDEGKGQVSKPDSHTNTRDHIEFLEIKELTPAFLQHYDMVILSLSYWNRIKSMNDSWLDYSPSLLIINHKKMYGSTEEHADRPRE
ncbi:MAG: cation:proton antiporter [Bacteroidales bacterium]